MIPTYTYGENNILFLEINCLAKELKRKGRNKNNFWQFATTYFMNGLL